MGCGASTAGGDIAPGNKPLRVELNGKTVQNLPSEPQHSAAPVTPADATAPTALQPTAEETQRSEQSKRNIEQLKKLWTRSFKAADPRQHLVEFFKPGDDRGPFGYLRAQGLRPRGEAAHYFSVWRPTSLTAIRMLFDGTATGKGLNVKGKSAQAGPLSGFVPFLQIYQEEHKRLVSLAPVDARSHIFFRTSLGRDQARKAMAAVALEMEVGARQGAKLLAAGANALTSEESRSAALRATAWTCSSYDLRPVDKYQHRGIYGLEVPERVLMEAYVMRQDISPPPGWETGRPSEPAFMDLNLHAIRDGSRPLACILQDDDESPMNPIRLLVAHEEPELAEESNPAAARALPVRPVASDLDAFLIGSKGMSFAGPIPDDQVGLMSWCIDGVERVLQTPGAQGWTKRWLELLKVNQFEIPHMPPYGFGDPQSYDIMEKAVQKLQFCGAVRHGAECFNFWFPQELDERFLVVWEGFVAYGGRVPWSYVDRQGLRDFLMGRVEDGYTFPLNPKWVLCDQGWLELYKAVLASPNSEAALETWLPVASGLRERIASIAAQHPSGFVPEGASDGAAVDDVDWDVANLQLERHRVLQRARRKLKAVFRFSQMGVKSKKCVVSIEEPGEPGGAAEAGEAEPEATGGAAVDGGITGE